ncbi:glycoside hydrolase superfamily, partial [Mycena maculata]
MRLGARFIAITLPGFLFLRVAAQSSTASAALSQSTLPVGSCTADIPCSNGACCNSESGYCGYGAPFCTTVADGGPCTSNCDAKAQCGPNAPAGEEDCPLKVCCSQFGFCGTTEDFCGTGCQSNCNPAVTASCGADQQSALNRRIGYYEGWAAARSCDAWTPSTMNVDSLTHLNFAFAYISSSFEVIEMTPGDSSLWTETTALKSRNPALKVFLSIGGWTFNDAPTSGIFSALAASESNTQTFIKSVLSVMNAYGFDGIDIDWEYPVAEDRGGSVGDLANYPTFLKAIKTAFGPFDYGLSFTAPSSYWYLQNYDLPALLADGVADWVNVMTYDLHGVWDSPADYIGSIVLAHTNLTEIELTFQLYANVGIDPSKITMGIGFYGRSFELVSASCSDPGCPFAGAAPAGPCSANPGTLMYTEIEDILASVGNSTNQLVFDEAAAVKYLVYNTIDWVSFDDQQTLGMKLQYANGICL